MACINLPNTACASSTCSTRSSSLTTPAGKSTSTLPRLTAQASRMALSPVISVTATASARVRWRSSQSGLSFLQNSAGLRPISRASSLALKRWPMP